MIVDDDGYIFCFDNDSIRTETKLDLTDDDCEDIAFYMEGMFEQFICHAAKTWMFENAQRKDAS